MNGYKAAISDTDILINLAKVGELKILNLLFSNIIIPAYVYEKEIKRKAGIHFHIIETEINKEDSIFQIVNREDDFVINKLAKPVISDKKDLIGPGESECAGYASAFGIPIIISDNSTEFKWLEEYITLTHNNILSLCVYFHHISDREGERIFNEINATLSKPTSLIFDEVYTRSFRRFQNCGWNDFLNIENT